MVLLLCYKVAYKDSTEKTKQPSIVLMTPSYVSQRLALALSTLN